MEYLLGLDINKDEHERRIIEKQIVELRSNWKQAIRDLELTIRKINGNLINTPNELEIITDDKLKAFQIMIGHETLEEHQQSLQIELQNTNSYFPKIKENYDSLHTELQSIQEKIIKIQAELIDLQEKKY